METHRRTMVKATLWQLVGLLVMAGLGFLFTGSIGSGGLLALFSALIGFVNYVIYERVWARISWGRING